MRTSDAPQVRLCSVRRYTQRSLEFFLLSPCRWVAVSYTPPSIAAAQLQPVVPPPPPKTKNHMLFLTFAIDPLHCSCCTRAPVTSARQSPRRSLYCVGILTHRSQLRKTALPRTRTTASSDASRRPARRCDCRWGFKRALRRERAACAMQRALSTHCKKPAYGRQSEGLRTMFCDVGYEYNRSSHRFVFVCRLRTVGRKPPS